MLLEGYDIPDRLQGYLQAIVSVERRLKVKIDQVWLKIEQYSLRYPSKMYPQDVADDVRASGDYVKALVEWCHENNKSVVFHFHGPQLVHVKNPYGARIYENHPEFDWVVKGDFAFANISNPKLIGYYENISKEVIELYAESGDTLFFDTVQIKYYEYSRLKGINITLGESMRAEEEYIGRLRSAIEEEARELGKDIHVSFLVHYLTVTEDAVHPWETGEIRELEVWRDKMYANYSDVIVAELVAEKALALVSNNLVEKYAEYINGLSRRKAVIVHLSVSNRPRTPSMLEYVEIAKRLKEGGVDGVVVAHFDPSDESVYSLLP